ncbi:MAG: TIGR01212 family radical SAM protein [Bacteroidales bacterium]|nr:TIGR01212 family radical SAM protein [Bacteroidales bacterium]
MYLWGDNRRFNSYKRFLQERFGGRMQKLTLNAGFTCPNRDGSIGVGGCTYCVNDAFNPSYCDVRKSVTQQLDEGIEFHQNRYRRADGYLAYFQAYSNTYASLEKMDEIYRPAIEHPDVKGIVVGTRPDCIDEGKLEYFAKLQEKMFVSIEYGVESCFDETLQRVNRGHTFQQAVNAFELTKKYGIHTAGHFMYGLPGETPDMWLDAVKMINDLPMNGIKFHQLQLIKNTKMEQEFYKKSSDFHLFTIDTYVPFIVDITERLNPSFVIERFAGEVPPRFLRENTWGLTRYDVVLQRIEKELERRDTFQGKIYLNYKN